jgi:hypothetical protein
MPAEGLQNLRPRKRIFIELVCKKREGFPRGPARCPACLFECGEYTLAKRFEQLPERSD